MLACKHEKIIRLHIMAKAVPLTLDTLKTQPVTPLAATPPRSPIIAVTDTPKITLIGKTMAAVSRVNLIAETASGSVNEAIYKSQP